MNVNISDTKSNKLLSELRTMIKSGKFSPGDRFYSQNDLCDMYGVSHITVRQAMAALVGEGFLERIQGKGTFITSTTAASKTDKVIGLVLCSELGVGYIGPFYSHVFDGIYEVARDCGYAIQVFSVKKSSKKGDTFEEMARMEHLQGVLTLGHLSEDITRKLGGFCSTVMVDHHLDDESLDSVVTDNRNGGYLATKHLLELGHRRIGFIKNYWKTGASSVKERFLGYSDALASYGIEISPELIVSGKNRLDRGYSAMKELLSLECPPTAVFAHNDEAAISALEAVRELRLKCPDDISIIGFDDVDLAELSYVPLSTIRVQKKEMGIRAAQKLIGIIENQEFAGKETLPIDLVVRQSTGKVKR